MKSEKRSQQFTTWLTFVDPIQQIRYQIFRRLNFSPASFFAFMGIMTFIFVIRISFALKNDRGILFTIAAISTLIFSIALGWILLYFRYFENEDDSEVQADKYLEVYWHSYSAKLENAFIICNSFNWGLILFARSTSDGCSSSELSNFFEIGFCNPVSASGAIPTDSVVGLVLLVSFIQSVVKGNQWWATFTAWFISVFFIVISLHQTGSIVEGVLIIVYAVAMGPILYEFERQTLSRYLQSLKVDFLEQNNFVNDLELRATQVRSQEMQQMIVHVAHDLQTPMQAFDHSLELLEVYLRAIARNMAINAELQQPLKHCIDGITSLSATSKYMSMLMSRSLDFSKVRGGHTLIPSIGSVEVSDAVLFPVKCIRVIDKQVPIVVDPFPTDISSHILSDKQWLHENVLCLLSNAVKFTKVGDGSAVVRVKLDLTMPERPLLRIEVEDHGCGVAKEDRHRLFEPLIMEDQDNNNNNNIKGSKSSSSSSSGSGLGLYSLALRMEALQGDCGMKPRSDGRHGAVFWFAIPYHPDPNADKAPRRLSYVEDLNEKVTEIKTRRISVGSILFNRERRPSVQREGGGGGEVNTGSTNNFLSTAVNNPARRISEFMATNFRGSSANIMAALVGTTYAAAPNNNNNNHSNSSNYTPNTTINIIGKENSTVDMTAGATGPGTTATATATTENTNSNRRRISFSGLLGSGFMRGNSNTSVVGTVMTGKGEDVAGEKGDFSAASAALNMSLHLNDKPKLKPSVRSGPRVAGKLVVIDSADEIDDAPINWCNSTEGQLKTRVPFKKSNTLTSSIMMEGLTSGSDHHSPSASGSGQDSPSFKPPLKKAYTGNLQSFTASAALVVEEEVKEELQFLIIEGEGDRLRVLQRSVQKEGFTCQLVSDVDTAMNRIESSLFDFIILDLQSPNELGKICLTKQRQLESNPYYNEALKQIFIGLTDDPKDVEKSKCKERGLDMCLRKPVLGKDVVRAVYALSPARRSTPITYKSPHSLSVEDIV